MTQQQYISIINSVSKPIKLVLVAYKNFKSSAESIYFVALYNLGCVYKNGQGVSQYRGSTLICYKNLVLFV